ncbi:hypothetical protein [Spongiactinospora sp. TRM90649]|uniref:hypothetical protein n=1 Tax=Spongiactinospora sp. TRM90649 TaxID=3031114 RepID=UPI0023F94C25|nr:hypothetical protein [Spongiactinospora sp. TRM90649]MDF5751634.1 hypothetical protein [Spongiactinospora sp. TRM90649]
MRTERVIPGLPCRDLDDVLPFYTALGFEVTYRQQRPNPFASVRRGGIELHFFSVPEFDPKDSMGTVVVVVPDTMVLHAAFAAGLRAEYGKVPVSGIPRMTRPRAKQGMTGGFTVVDPGGNWLRISRLDETEENAEQPKGRLGRALAAAARQADSHGDVEAGIRLLVNGLARHADAPPADRFPALVYLAELHHRTGDHTSATASLTEAQALPLTPTDREALATDLAAATEIATELNLQTPTE